MRKADFSVAIRKTVAIRSNNLCNNPSCRKRTLAESKEDGLVIDMGKACHIEAASPKGPRYNPESTVEYRKSVENAIWLCPTCADLIDKDYKSYSVQRLKQWKRDSECNYSSKTGLRIFAVANAAGGVGKSSMTAYLAQACAFLTKLNVLCISVGAYDFCGGILNGEWDYRNKISDVIKTKIETVYYMSDHAIKNLSDDKKRTLGKSDLCTGIMEVAREYKIKYIFVDYGSTEHEMKKELAYMATDFIIPIGDHVFTSGGIDTISAHYLEPVKNQLRVWPVYSKGLKMSNTESRRKWYSQLRRSINKIIELPHVKVIEACTIIPESSYVKTKNIFSCRKTKNVAEAYLSMAAEILGVDEA